MKRRVLDDDTVYMWAAEPTIRESKTKSCFEDGHNNDLRNVRNTAGIYVLSLRNKIHISVKLP